MKETHVRARTKAEIEAEIERDRAALVASIKALKDRLSVEALVDHGLIEAKARFAPLGKQFQQTVAANPIATALVTAGIAWLILGRRPTDCDTDDHR